MNYRKPQIILVESALAAIQGSSQMKGTHSADLYVEPFGQPNATVGAYEADE